jgi:NAD(P)-dependent dehydrogenase (short-subunit alcohol dehydrogenase family)
MDLELRGKTAIVTGGSRGIGKAIARELVQEGVDVALVARDRQTAEATAAELARQSGRRVLALLADTGDDSAVRNAVADAAVQLGHLDILVNCAARPGGQATPPRLSEITAEQFWADVNVKVMGYLRCAREVAPHMVRQRWGRIINISGLAARESGEMIGSIRNVAVVALTKNLADELGPFGINVTVVHPGSTRTERTAGTLAQQAQTLGVSQQEVERRMVEGTLVGRLITAQEIAYVVTFLASPKAVAINGDVIAAGGGVPRTIHY